jgi:predicted nucleic acid-binding protein
MAQSPFPVLILIDTNLFEATNFNYNTHQFKRLLELAAQGKVRLVTTEIVNQEVRAHIRQAVDDASTAAKKFRQEARVLADLALPGFEKVFKRLEKDAVVELLLIKFADLQKGLNTITVGCEGADTNQVFADYFAQKPPFGEGKKKSEFPDAFTLASSAKWTEANNRNLYIISDDEGVRESAKTYPTFTPLSSIDQLLNIVSALEAQEPTRLAHLWADQNRETLQRAVALAFQQLDFYIDEDGEVEDVNVRDVEVFDTNVAFAGDNRVTYLLLVDIKFDVKVRYVDPSSGIWDSEDKVMFGQETVRTTLERTHIADAKAEVQFSPRLPEAGEVLDVVIDNSDDIAITVDEPYG